MNYNGGALLAQSLTALLAQDFTDFEAVLIDNASTDDSISALPETVTADPRLQIIRNVANRGFAAANNQAGLSATTDWIACLNPDAVPNRDWLSQLLAATGAHPACDFFGSTQLSLSDPGIVDGLGDHLHALGMPWRAGHGQKIAAPYPSGEVFGPCAAAALYRAETFKKLNGFCESFFCYNEDVDLAYRHRLQGGTARQAGAAVVHHYGSFATGHRSDFCTYYGFRNMVWTYLRCTPAPLFALLLPLHFVACSLMWAVAVGRGQGPIALQAFTDAWLDWSQVRLQRKAIQAEKTVGWRTILKALAWSPQAVLKHQVRWLDRKG